MVDDMSSAHEFRGSVTDRLDRLEQSLIELKSEVRDLRASSTERRSTDESRIRKLEDTMLVWDTRWSTVNTMLTRVFGVSIVGAVASVLAIITAVSQ
jgi:predicted  nucleic acid-binding Zn-ribbon protein